MGAVAGWFAGGYPRRRYPTVVVGSSNGALAHLAAALQVPWLPGTVLVLVSRVADPHRPVDAMEFGRRHAPALLDANPDVTLHHMHDQVQDELMVARMTYFRIKWRGLPDGYADFLADTLAPSTPVVLVEDRSSWPVVRIGDRNVFQTGAQGGLEPQAYLDRPQTPQPDDEAPEAEWGADPGFAAGVVRWCAENDHPLVRIAFTGPQAPAHAVAGVMRDWYVSRGEDADRLLVPSFVLGDPWRTINTASVPYWTFFSVQPALRAFADHLERSAPYREIDILLFQHGVESAGIARPDEWTSVVRAMARLPDYWPWIATGSRTTSHPSPATAVRWPGCRPPGHRGRRSSSTGRWMAYAVKVSPSAGQGRCRRDHVDAHFGISAATHRVVDREEPARVDKRGGRDGFSG